MKYKRFGSRMVLRIDRGEEVLTQLHRAAEQLTRELPRAQLKLRENLSLLAVLQGGKGAAANIVAAVQDAGVPVHELAHADACLLLIVNDSQFETALKAAYGAR